MTEDIEVVEVPCDCDCDKAAETERLLDVEGSPHP